MMASLRHPSIVMYLGVCLDPPAVVTEYCARGSLNDVLKRARSSPLLAAQLDWARRLNMALDAAKGMLYLHSCAPPIIHRDLKSANLLVDKHWRVRVCDFNLSRAMEDNAVLSSMAATNPRWLAPEILSGKGYTFASDVYSFGICMWELLTWQVPYWEYGPWQVVAMVTENAKRPEVPPHEELPTGTFSKEGEYLALMHECWAQDPAQRPTFAAIISRLRRMLAAEASLRRDSPTKASRGRGSDVGLVQSGDDTPLARSHLASLSVPSASDSLCVSPLDPRSVGDEAVSVVSLEGASGSPGPLPSAAHARRSSAGGASQLASIAGGDTDEAEAADAAEAAAAAAAAAGGMQPPPAAGAAAASAIPPRTDERPPS
jgi:serine/threonine protein kinase